MSSSLSCWDSDRLRVGLSLVRAVRKPCLRRSLLTSSSSLLDPSLGTTTTPSPSNSSSELKDPSTVRTGKPIELVVGIFEIADSDLVDLCPSPPEVRRQLMVGSGTRMICSVSKVRASIKCSKDVCCSAHGQYGLEGDRVGATYFGKYKNLLAVGTFRRELDASDTPPRRPRPTSAPIPEILFVYETASLSSSPSFPASCAISFENLERFRTAHIPNNSYPFLTCHGEFHSICRIRC